MKETKKEKVLTIIGVMTILLFGVGATFAYFVAQGGSSEQTNINVTTHTTDSLVFEVGKAISITADQTTFAPGAGNRSDNTFARATLKANSSTNSATEHYYVYLAIDRNDFIYTTTEKTAELILTVNYKDNDGNITPIEIEGLTPVTVGNVTGYDITKNQNLITIADNHEITSTGTEVDEWDITLTLVNLDANQTANAGKTFNATLLIQKEETFAGHIASLYTTQGSNNLYYHNGTIVVTEENATNAIKAGSILDAEDYSYRYSGGDYEIAPAYKEIYSSIDANRANETTSIIGFMCGDTDSFVGATCYEFNIIDDDNFEYRNKPSYYYLKYEENETKTQYVTYKEALAKAIEDGYVIETPVNNYVCFGSNEEVCPYDNLYRIIGIINGKAKLIKADYATKELLGEDGDYYANYLKENFIPEEYNNKAYNSRYKGNLSSLDGFYWNGVNNDKAFSETGYRNIWSYSELNKTNLNTNFLNNIGTEWSNKITTSVWYISGFHTDVASRQYSKRVYNYEIKGDTIDAKVGLMYVHEYLYATYADNWTKRYANAVVNNFNWMNLGGYEEYTITRNGSTNSRVDDGIYTITNFSSTYSVSASSGLAGWGGYVRPVFSLNSNVIYDGGSGTSSDPYRIA